jgi:hypothetical protein
MFHDETMNNAQNRNKNKPQKPSIVDIASWLNSLSIKALHFVMSLGSISAIALSGNYKEE